MSIRQSMRGSGRKASVAVAGLAVLLAACGGGGGGSGTPSGGGGTSSPSPTAGTGDDGGSDDGGDDLPPEIAAAAAAAEAAGMIFFTSRDEIVRLAMENGPFNGYISAEQTEMAAENFEADTGIPSTVEDFSGTDAYTRFLLEAQSGALSGLDVQQHPPEVYSEFAEFTMPYDIYGMAEVGILDIPLEMVDPERRNIVAVGSQIAGYAYNPNMIDPSVIPTTWEGFCDMSFLEGRRFMLDLRPSNMAPMVEKLGIDKVLEIADCLVEADPILTRGTTDALTRVTAGEVPLHIFTNYHSAMRAAASAQGNLAAGLIEPVPIRLSNALGVMNETISNNPYAGLLFIEWMAGPRGQEVLDADPLKSSVYAAGSDIGTVTAGMELSGEGFEAYVSLEEYMSTIADRLGFPTG